MTAIFSFIVLRIILIFLNPRPAGPVYIRSRATATLTDDCHLVFCRGNTKQIKSIKRQPNYNIFGIPWWKIPDFHSINELLARSFIRESLTPIEQEDKMAILSSRHIFTGHVLLDCT